MSDEARIARLTELARKVWPEENVQIGNPKGKAPAKSGVFVASSEWTLLGVGAHPRALDALEAALLVLADVDDAAEAEQGVGWRVAVAAGMQAGLGRLEGFKDAVRLEIDTQYTERLSALADEQHELAALRALVFQLFMMAGPKP